MQCSVAVFDLLCVLRSEICGMVYRLDLRSENCLWFVEIRKLLVVC
jgi:hypothetical protein